MSGYRFLTSCNRTFLILVLYHSLLGFFIVTPGFRFIPAFSLLLSCDPE